MTEPFDYPTLQARWLAEHGASSVRCVCQETGKARGQCCPVHDLGLTPAAETILPDSEAR